MKIGIISDIHSNIEALKEVFQEFKKRNVEKIICLGDIIGIGPYPEKCIQFLMDNENMIISFVRGNHERYLIKGIPTTAHDKPNMRILTKEEIGTHKWNHGRLNKQQIDYIKNLKERDIICIEEKYIVVEHYPMDSNNKFNKFYKCANAYELEEIFEKKDADIYLFGHTHKENQCTINNKLFINPGSLGCPKGIRNGILWNS